MPTVTAVVSDTHIGSYTGLALHEWECDTGLINQDGTPMTHKYTAHLAQDWLLDCWKDFWAYGKKLAGKKSRLIVIHLGDVVDGNHHQTVQAMPNLGDQIAMAVEILKPLANLDGLYIMRGTEAHAGEAAQSEVRIASELGATCMWEGLFQIKGGPLLDCAHHGRAGQRDWTSSAAAMAASAQLDAINDNPPRPAPRYVFRGHNHIVDDSGAKVPMTQAIALPSWELRTAYGYKNASGRRSDIGGLYILPDGSLDLSNLRYYAAPGQRKVIEI